MRPVTFKLILKPAAYIILTHPYTKVYSWRQKINRLSIFRRQIPIYNALWVIMHNLNSSR